MAHNPTTDPRTPTGIDAHIDWKTSRDKRPDLFQADESSGLHFPCNGCLHASASATYCKGCKHYTQ